jgi:hypothetical protein
VLVVVRGNKAGTRQRDLVQVVFAFRLARLSSDTYGRISYTSSSFLCLPPRYPAQVKLPDPKQSIHFPFPLLLSFFSRERLLSASNVGSV